MSIVLDDENIHHAEKYGVLFTRQATPSSSFLIECSVTSTLLRNGSKFVVKGGIFCYCLGVRKLGKLNRIMKVEK